MTNIFSTLVSFKTYRYEKTDEKTNLQSTYINLTQVIKQY